jgi:hypothetical protein
MIQPPERASKSGCQLFGTFFLIFCSGRVHKIENSKVKKIEFSNIEKNNIEKIKIEKNMIENL